MKYRMALWAALGLCIAAGWAIYALATGPFAITPARPLVWTLAHLSCPIVLVGYYLHFGVSVCWSLIVNTITYLLLGAAVELLRSSRPHPMNSNA